MRTATALIASALLLVGCDDGDEAASGADCVLSSDCPAAQRCFEGACVAASDCDGGACGCAADEDCPEGALCSGGRCEERACEDDRGCALGQVCAAGRCATDLGADRDRDGLPDLEDNCPEVPNPQDPDLDGDGAGNACDDDDDGDGVPDALDDCPAVADPGQADADGDGVGNACDDDWRGVTVRGRLEVRSDEAARFDDVSVVIVGPGAPRRTTTPAEDGAFAFDELTVAGLHVVEVEWAGFAVPSRSVYIDLGTPTIDLGSLVAAHDSFGPRAVPLAGHVTLRGESDHADTVVRVRVAGADLAFTATETAPDGAFSVPASRAERYRLVIQRAGWRDPEPDVAYRWYEDAEAETGGYFGPDTGSPGPIAIELVPSDAPVCADGEVSPCVEPAGVCVGSRRVCANGQWGPCAGQAEERCDALDNDCDGETDEAIVGAFACDLHAAAATCQAGRCVVVQCLGSAVDVDGLAANGCECAPTGPEGEDCDNVDNDCDGATDEDLDLLTNPEHCGACGLACDFRNARSTCVDGACQIVACEDGFYDFDGDLRTGCEAACEITEGGAEICDYVDNDCDGTADEDFAPLDENVRHCGVCGNDCRRFPNGAFACEARACVVVACDPGFRDLDGEVVNGCEYPCLPTEGGREICDEIDNDCDGRVDEDFDLLADVLHCGGCGNACRTPNAAPDCRDGRCRVLRCDAGFVDANLNAADGCEANCVGAEEQCNDVDDDCDGDVDEDYPELGQPCSVGLGECREAGVFLCVADGRGLRCGAVPRLPTDEICDAFDNDCDGSADEDFDRDGDRATTCAGDCNDDAPDVRPGARETCDRRDEDCDGAVDEDFDLATDPEHCGRCGRVCDLPAAVAICRDGACAVESCGPDRHDVDFLADNGCEYPCVVRNGGMETCDGRDEDCDGALDEDFRVGAPCDGIGACGLGQLECRADGDAGCSTQPGGSLDRSGPELCNLRDDDCDGETDEGYDLLTDLAHCGGCGVACAPDGAEPACVGGRCTVAACLAGRHDLDARVDNGCEYACVHADAGAERCDGRDQDCDGAVDEGFGVGDFCVAPGACGAGALECALDGASTRCSTAPGATDDRSVPERCNDRDDDCDGAIDEAVSAELTAADPHNCGACGRICPQRPDAVATCTDGECGYVCAQGFIDDDGLEANGCEVSCGAPQVEQVIDGDVAAIRAALGRVGRCGRIEVGGEVVIADEAVIEIDEPGVTVRGLAGMGLTVSASSEEPLFRITASGVTLSNLRIATAEDVHRSLIKVRRAQTVRLENITLEQPRVGCNPESPRRTFVIDLDEAADVTVSALVATDFDFVQQDLAPECEPVWVGVVGAVDSARVAIEDSVITQAPEGAFRAAGQRALIALDATHDSRITNNILRFRFVDSDAGPIRVLRLRSAQRNRVARNDLLGVDGFGGGGGAIGLTLSGVDNEILLNRFGEDEGVTGRHCLWMAVELADTRNDVRDNTFYGAPFLVAGRPRTGEVISLDTRLPALPTNLGALVVANARSPVISGVNIRLDEDPLCDRLWLRQQPTERAAAVLVTDSTDVTIEGVVTDPLPGVYDEDACFRAGIMLDGVRGARVAGNVTEAGRGRNFSQDCPDRDNGSVLVRRGSDVEIGANTLLAVGRTGDSILGSLQIDESPRSHVHDLEATALAIDDSPDALVEDVRVVESLSMNDTPRAVVRRVLMSEVGSESDYATLSLSGDGALLEDARLGRADCPASEHYRLWLAGDQVEVRGLRGLCLDNTTLTTPFDRETTLRVRQSLLEQRDSTIYLRGYGIPHFENVTVVHRGESDQLLFYSDTVAATLTNSVIQGFADFFTYGRGQPCCGIVPGVTVHHTDFWQMGVLEGAELGDAVVEVDPRFRAPGAGDYRLAPGSPAIDAGDPASPVGDEPAPNGGRINLGAFGGTAEAAASTP